MADYISREAAYKVVTRTCNKNCRGQMCLYTEDMLDDLEDIPRANVQDVHGQWVNAIGSDIKLCSNCHNEAYWDTDYGQQLFDFCPYCGAEMDRTDLE